MPGTSTDEQDDWVTTALGLDLRGSSQGNQAPSSKLSPFQRFTTDAKNVGGDVASEVNIHAEAVQQAGLGLIDKAGEKADDAKEALKRVIGWGKPGTAAPTGPVTLTSKTEEANPGPRTRTRLGVGERVVLAVTGGAGDWHCSGGKLSAKTGTTVTLTAPPRPGTTEVSVDIGGKKASLSFTVVAPNAVTMTLLASNHDSNGQPNAGMTLQPYFGPADVNFTNVSFTEDDIGAKATGCWDEFNSIGHQPNKQPLPCTNTVVSGKGTLVNANDGVQSGCIVHNPPLTDWSGTLTFNIPWHWHCGSGSGLIARVLHRVVTNAAGSTTISKGGASFTAALS